MRVRSVDVLGLCRVERGILLVLVEDGRWSLPGGQVRHGEHPRDAVLRTAHQQTGRRFSVARVLDVLTDFERVDGHRGVRHHDRIVYGIELLPGRDELRGSIVAESKLDEWPVTAVTAVALGVSEAVTDIELPAAAQQVGGEPGRRQRFAAYGLVTNPAGDVLLTQISPGYPGAGRWHLPGGGTDFGETPTAGLQREIAEETGQRGTVGELLAVSHRHQTDALGPEGVPIDWHGIRVVYRVHVEHPSTAVVVDGGGSTDAAAWIAPAAALRLPLTEVALEMIMQHAGGKTGR